MEHKQRFPFKGCKLPRLPLHVYLSYLLVCTLLLTGVSFAKYVTTASGSDGARVAAGKVEVTHQARTNLELKVTGPTFDSFSFEVSNASSEVAIRYDLELTLLDGPLPKGVTMILNKVDEKGKIEETKGVFFGDDVQTKFSFPKAGVFQAGSPTTDRYVLGFIGDFETVIRDDYNSDISISIEAEQID